LKEINNKKRRTPSIKTGVFYMVNNTTSKDLAEKSKSQNGTAKPSANAEISKSSVGQSEKGKGVLITAAVAKSNPTPVVQLPAAVKLPSLQERLKKLAELQNLVDRRDLLVEHLDNVAAFDYKSPNANGTIRFTDSKGISFQFSNSAVIADCVPMIKERLTKQIEEVESKIAFTF
jgi:hypothetical protein